MRWCVSIGAVLVLGAVFGDEVARVRMHWFRKLDEPVGPRRSLVDD